VGLVSGLDRSQRRFAVLGVPLAIWYKFVDDQGNYLAATITYYAFIAIFPCCCSAARSSASSSRATRGWRAGSSTRRWRTSRSSATSSAARVG
jgi:uncharacterized BrkB/YihY/UPF0761 family membrane protein